MTDARNENPQVAAFTGMRRSEILALRLDQDIDLDRATISVHQECGGHKEARSANRDAKVKELGS
jgi:integrase